jgi:hypothetical protein
MTKITDKNLLWIIYEKEETYYVFIALITLPNTLFANDTEQ